MRSTTIYNQVLGLVVGDPERYKDSAIYKKVKDLKYTQGPGLTVKANNEYVWHGNTRSKYDALRRLIAGKAGLDREETSALWSFLDRKRSQAWYVRDTTDEQSKPCRSEASRLDEEETKELVSFEANGLTVKLENGYTLGHFMQFHYGVNDFTYKLWNEHIGGAVESKPVSKGNAPVVTQETVSEDWIGRISSYIGLELNAQFPLWSRPELMVEKTTVKGELKTMQIRLGIVEDRMAIATLDVDIANLKKALKEV